MHGLLVVVGVCGVVCASTNVCCFCFVVALVGLFVGRDGMPDFVFLFDVLAQIKQKK